MLQSAMQNSLIFFVIYHVFAISDHYSVFLRLGYLVDVNVLAFISPGPVPKGVM